MDKRVYAVVTILLGSGMGLIGNLFFNQKLVGLSFPLFIVIAFVVLLGFTRYAKSPPNRRSLWLVIPMLFFAIMVAIRAEMGITILNVLAVVWLGGLLLHYWRDAKGLDQESFSEQLGSVIATGTHMVFDPFIQLAQANGWLREHQPLRGTGVRSVGRGLVLTTPVVGVFALLLVSADSKFSEFANQVFGIFRITSGFDVMLNGFFIFSIGWLSIGALAYSVLRRTSSGKYVQTDDGEAVEFEADPTAESEDKASPRKKHPFLLGMVESGIMLGSVNLLFAAFVVVQFAYFFGGEQNISVASGWNYAHYARRGFFELVAVSVLTLGLILWLDWITVRSNTTQHTIFRVLAVAIVALTGVMLVSAHGRMVLYEQAYGFTHLRLYVHVFMAWLGVLFAIFVVYLFRAHTQIFSLGMTLCIIGYLVTMNLINVDATIARQNIARAQNGREIDVRYLYTWSVDAVPVVLPYYLSLSNPEEHELVGQWLLRQREILSRQRTDMTFFSLHASREIGWFMLRTARIHAETSYG